LPHPELCEQELDNDVWELKATNVEAREANPKKKSSPEPERGLHKLFQKAR
jgi:hypothetical protein